MTGHNDREVIVGIDIIPGRLGESIVHEIFQQIAGQLIDIGVEITSMRLEIRGMEL